MTHTFTQSGLGKAPFKIINPKQHPIEDGGVFWCEHCGTQLKHRYFVESSNGKVSVVGIDCAQKTGDQGLIEGIKRLKREQKAQDRMEKMEATLRDREEKERESNGGMTNNELAMKLDAQREELLSNHVISMHSNELVNSLTKFGFEMDMQHQAFLGRPYSKGQLSILKEIHTKKSSGSRKGSKAYLKAYEHCADQVDELQHNLQEIAEEAESLRQKALHLRFG